jgi:hypothetical protein
VGDGNKVSIKNNIKKLFRSFPPPNKNHLGDFQEMIFSKEHKIFPLVYLELDVNDRLRSIC